jgi:hypothetical protein
MDDKAISYILEWAENYFKSRDAYKKEIVKIEKQPDHLIISYKDRQEKIFAFSELSTSAEKNISNNVSFITLNDKKNVDWLCNNWNKMTSINAFRVYFINPLSNTDKKWVINPHVHAKICDESALKLGMNTMFETVEPISLEILRSRL